MSKLSEKIAVALNTKRKLVEYELVVNKKPKYGPKLCRDFFEVPCMILAKALLGKVLVRRLHENNTILKGRIVETECYLGSEDKASHSYNGRRTISNEPMYMQPGTSYVYIIYGIYHCFNISSMEAGGAVLIRALEPLEGIEEMQRFRSVRKSRPPKVQELCKGPSNLCTSFNISKDVCNKIDLTDSSLLWLENDANFVDNFSVVKTSRVGISSSADEWKYEPLRFYIKGNPCVSRPDRNKEKELPTT